jgi:lipopolysaccharide export system protein LptC
MYSRTDQIHDNRDELLQAAVRRARLAPLLSLLVAAAGLGLVLFFMFQSDLFSAFLPKEEPVAVTVKNPEQITSQNSRIAGFDQQRQPYDVTAKKGFQDKDNPDLVHLETVVGNLMKLTGETFQMLSHSATYDSKGKQLEMQGDVKIIQPGRFTASMDKAHVNMQTKELMSNVPVDVEMTTGTIHANGMKISNDGNTIVFLNGVKARFEEAAKKGDEAP